MADILSQDEISALLSVTESDGVILGRSGIEDQKRPGDHATG